RLPPDARIQLIAKHVEIVFVAPQAQLVLLLREWPGPVALEFLRAVGRNREAVASRHLANAGERRLVARDGPEAQRLQDCDRGERKANVRMRGQRFDFRRKPHRVAGARPEQRADSKRIADQYNLPAIEINDRDRELAVEARRHGEALALVELEQDLDLRVGCERLAAIGEFAPQVAIVEDLTVEDERNRAIPRERRWRSAREIDHRQTDHADAVAVAAEPRDIVRAAIADRRQHTGQHGLPARGAGRIVEAGYSTHDE